MSFGNGAGGSSEFKRQPNNAQACVPAAMVHHERPNLHNANQWSISRVILTVVGMIGLGIFFLVLYGLLHPNPAAEALRNSKAAVAFHLKDAGSAEYRNLRVYSMNAGRLVVCGEVNSRNSFGAMAGYVRFIGVNAGEAVVETDMVDRTSFDDLWATRGCTGSTGDLVMAE